MRKERKKLKKKKKKTGKKRNARKKRKAEKKASAVAKPGKGGTHPVSVEEKDDQPSDGDVDRAERKHVAGTKDESAQYSDASEYEPSDDDDDEDAQREQQRSKERAKF